MNVLAQTALGLCCVALGMNQALAADSTEIDMTCDSEKPVIMLVAGRTLDAERMRDYAIALGSSELYPNPLPKSEYPKYSANDWYEAAELFNSFVTKADLADKSKTSLPEVGTWSRTGPWLPWMEMAD